MLCALVVHRLLSKHKKYQVILSNSFLCISFKVGVFVVLLKVERFEHQTVIKFFVKGSFNQNFLKLMKVYRDTCPLF